MTSPSPSPSPSSPPSVFLSVFPPSVSSDQSALHKAWRFGSWLQQYPLNRSSVLDYFKHSIFFTEEANAVGDFVLSSANESANFVIRHIERNPSNSSPPLPLRVFFVVGEDSPTSLTQKGTVFEMPSVLSVFTCNVQSALFYAKEAVDCANEKFTVTKTKGIQWEREGEEEGRATQNPSIHSAHPQSHLFQQIISEEIQNFQLEMQRQNE